MKLLTNSDIHNCYSAQNGSESRFHDRCFLFFVLSSVMYYGLFYCTTGFVLRHWRLIAPLELYCAIVSGYYLSFKLSGKVVFLLGPELPNKKGKQHK